jgi:hypothetical protein
MPAVMEVDDDWKFDSGWNDDGDASFGDGWD